MKVRELIKKLEYLESQMGDVEVRTYSDDYCCDLHKIEDVTEGYHNGWNSINDVIGICITK